MSSRRTSRAAAMPAIGREKAVILDGSGGYFALSEQSGQAVGGPRTPIAAAAEAQAGPLLRVGVTTR
jgi:hypothetical protein